MASTKPSTILHDFSQGHAVRAQEFMGAHPAVQDGQDGWVFRVWAPHAQSVAVILIFYQHTLSYMLHKFYGFF